MNKLTSIGLLCFIMCSAVLFGQEAYYQGNFVRNDNNTYRQNIRTVLLYKAGFELTPPIIQLNTTEKLLLSFDDMDADHKDYRYTILQCDASWNPSELQQMEYLDGFFEDYIDDYKVSYNTTTRFMNYVLVFPTSDLKIRKSGNYIIKVYLDNPNDENVVITRRFIVYEPMVDVMVNINKSMDLNNRYTHQQVDIRINTMNYTITDSYRDLHLVILQNGRWDNAILNAQPRMITGNLFDYSMQRDLAFPAGNEFRYLDMKTLKYNTDRMKMITYETDGYHVFVMTDGVRSNGNYKSEDDINGRRLISVNQARDPYTEADYAWVHFLLPYKAPLAEGSLYVAGSFSDWQYLPSNKMSYNYDLKAYEAKVFVKQGYYNYAYVFLPNRSQAGDLGLVEGNYWETENEYAVLVYHRKVGDLYDRVIGAGFANSGQ